ncbi:MAG: Uma2 family endonuclease [Xenococcus sp. (in: cyanobacteria)]
MTTAARKFTLEEYLNYENDSDQHYELVAGNLTEMPPESPQNAEIAIKLLLVFAQFVTPRLLRCKDTEIVVSGSRTNVRLPDLMVLTEDLADALYRSGRSTIISDMPPPALVVEVVSPGKVNQDRDYRYKRSEYAARGIGEYWIIDPQLEKVTVLILNQGLYDQTEFTEDNAISSVLFPQLELTANEIFT